MTFGATALRPVTKQHIVAGAYCELAKLLTSWQPRSTLETGGAASCSPYTCTNPVT